MTTDTLEELPNVKSRMMFDQKLWEALAPDREKFPYLRPRHDAATIFPCPGCGKDTRGRGMSAEDAPGTVVRYTSNGLCDRCWKIHPHLRPGQGETRIQLSRDTLTTCPGTEGRPCGKRTRSQYESAERFPGTSKRVNNSGICRPCYRRKTGKR